MKRILLSLCCLTAASTLTADEGMWPLPVIEQQMARMQSLGLRLSARDIYHPDSSSLKDAVVIFGRGCTGEVISSQGLVLTNHHCGYDQIQSHSTVEHDYLTHGFWAMSQQQELPCRDLQVAFVERVEDVTEAVEQALSQPEPGASPTRFLSARWLDSLARRLTAGRTPASDRYTQYEIRPFYGGNVYYLFTKRVYPDVRLVGAPPSSIGKFGADTDNWIWPRHTGDFSLFRIYADASGNPAPYSPSNRPLRPKRWLPISLRGIRENDFAMMIGFPGRTNRYYTSGEVAERRDIDNAIRIRFREVRQQAMLEQMLADAATRIQYAGKYAYSTNAYKNAIGSSWAINNQRFESLKRDRQQRLRQQALQQGRPEYAAAVDSLEQIVARRADLRRRQWALDEGVIRGIECASLTVDLAAVTAALDSNQTAARRHAVDRLRKAFKQLHNADYSPRVDRIIAKAMLTEYLRWIPADGQPAGFDAIRTRFGGDVGRFVDDLFDRSLFADSVRFERFAARPSVKSLQNDPMLAFARAVQAERKRLAAELERFDTGYARAHRTYVKGLLEFGIDPVSWPDANSTLRMTYGQVRGYEPKDGVAYSYRTTLDGVMQKEDSTNWEFVVHPRLKQLYEAKDYGRYGVDGRMPVCFAASTHSTGGNSGSPVLNADGELIGLNFDRNWEGVGGDIQYLPDYQRSIIADIRYLLFIIDRFAGAGYLIDEMEIRQ